MILEFSRENVIRLKCHLLASFDDTEKFRLSHLYETCYISTKKMLEHWHPESIPKTYDNIGGKLED
jgi:hypothetical protein